MELTPTLKYPTEQVDKKEVTYQDDVLGNMLYNKWFGWQTARLGIEEEWYKRIRAFNKINEPDSPKSAHDHIYIGVVHTKCMSSYARQIDLLFQSHDDHWGIQPTPIPKSKKKKEESEAAKFYMAEMAEKAQKMSTVIHDQLLDMRYEDHLKSAMLECSILGIGCVKGVIPNVKKEVKWRNVDGNWKTVIDEVPSASIASPTIFNIYVDPYATKKDKSNGVFERHVLTFAELSDLKEDPRFNVDKINEILSRSINGNHIQLNHENQRMIISGIGTRASMVDSDRYDLLEFWGQIPGRILVMTGCHGLDEIDEVESYWCNVWTCGGLTLMSQVMPMEKQRIPYNFFVYNEIPYSFYGDSPASLGASSQAGINGSIRTMLDAAAFSSIPQAEVNVNFLKDGEDPANIYPGKVWMRDAGDGANQAVRFFQPQSNVGQFMEIANLMKGLADDETAIPAYTYGDHRQEANKTAQGMSMQMGAAALPIKQVIKNLEDGCIKPLIESLYDWNMQWNDDESIKGDMQIRVLASSALLAREIKSQRIMQFLSNTNNPTDIGFVDRQHLLAEAANAMELDAAKAVPDKPAQPQQPQEQQQPDPMLQPKLDFMMAQAAKERALTEKAMAQTSEINVKTQYAGVQTAAQVLTNPKIIPTTDQLLLSAGYKDHNGAPLAVQNAGQMIDTQGIPQVQENTSPQYPPVPQQAQVELPPMPATQNTAGMASPMGGMETPQQGDI